MDSLPQAREERRTSLLLGLLVALAYLIPALCVLGDYGPTYDAVKGDYPYGERLLGYLETHDERFLDLKAYEPVPERRAPHPDYDLQRWPSHWVFPIAGLLSALSCRILWTELGWVPAQAAHHVPFVLLAALTIAAVSAFACRRLGRLAGIVAGGSLALAPVYFGHAFNNPKDITECCFYTLAVLAGLLALERGGVRPWLLAGGWTGLALAQKANALFLPVQLGLFVGGLLLLRRFRNGPEVRLGARDLLAAAAGFLGCYYAASPAFWSAPIDGPLQWIGQMVRTGNSAARGEHAPPAGISFHGPLAVLLTTPLATLLLACLGLLRARLDLRLRWFLVVSTLLPIARNLLPGMRSFDGVRHFFEFLPFLCLLAGAGAVWLLERARRLPAAPVLVATLALAPSLHAVVTLHPNQITFFNLAAGRLGTQQRLRNGDASDYWGNTYWQGMAWLSAQAEPGAKLLVPFKDFIARAGAPVRLRADVRILDLMEAGPAKLPLYVMHLVNKGAGPFEDAIDAAQAPVHEIRAQNGSLLHLHLLADDESGRRLIGIWQGEFERRSLQGGVMKFLGKDKALQARVLALVRQRLPLADTLAELRPLVPPDVLTRIEALLTGRTDDEDREP